MLFYHVRALGEEGQIDEGIEAMKNACLVFEEENRGELHEATFKKAINFAVNKQKYTEAIDLIKRQNAIYKQHMATFEKDLHKNFLSIVVSSVTEYLFSKY